MLTLLHNPRCSKSRDSLKILEESGKPYKIRNYQESPLKREELTELLEKLDAEPSTILRKKENLISDLGLDIDSEDKCFEAIINYPQLLERPILIDQDKAIIGRPPENILNYLKDR
ncbi:MAG: hypothetical protein K9K67_13905 [Bacteriovoracaceae bacterium]|nr:hypothetical protein [Bacteriovoracaceae bacterium]